MNMPLLTSNLKTPKIIWHQTDVIVCIRIQLIDVKNYFLRIDRDTLRFSTNVNNEKYYVIINLYGAIFAEKSITKNTGREIKVYICKAHTGTEWLRLHLETEKNPMIIADPDHVYIPEWTKPMPWDAKKESFTEYKIRNKIQNILPDVPSSGEEDSDDEIFDNYFD